MVVDGTQCTSAAVRFLGRAEPRRIRGRLRRGRYRRDPTPKLLLSRGSAFVGRLPCRGGGVDTGVTRGRSRARVCVKKCRRRSKLLGVRKHGKVVVPKKRSSHRSNRQTDAARRTSRGMASGSTAAAPAVAVAPLNDPAEMAALRRLYCEGPVLAAAQRLKIWPDSKDFVDTPTKAPASAVLRAWEENPPADDDAARAFIATWFEAGPPVPSARAGEAATLPDAANVSPRDWHPEGPPFALERFNKYIQLTRGDASGTERGFRVERGNRRGSFRARRRDVSRRNSRSGVRLHFNPPASHLHRPRRAVPRDVLLGLVLDGFRPDRVRHAGHRRGRDAQSASPRRAIRLRSKRRARVLPEPNAAARVGVHV